MDSLNQLLIQGSIRLQLQSFYTFDLLLEPKSLEITYTNSPTLILNWHSCHKTLQLGHYQQSTVKTLNWFFRRTIWMIRKRKWKSKRWEGHVAGMTRLEKCVAWKIWWEYLKGLSVNVDGIGWGGDGVMMGWWHQKRGLEYVKRVWIT